MENNQNSNMSQPAPEPTRAGGPDDTRGINQPDQSDENTKPQSQKEQDQVWR